MTILEAVKKAGEDGFIGRANLWYSVNNMAVLSFDRHSILASDWEAKPKKRRWKLHVWYDGSGHVATGGCEHQIGECPESVSVVEED